MTRAIAPTLAGLEAAAVWLAEYAEDLGLYPEQVDAVERAIGKLTRATEHRATVGIAEQEYLDATRIAWHEDPLISFPDREHWHGDVTSWRFTVANRAAGAYYWSSNPVTRDDSGAIVTMEDETQVRGPFRSAAECRLAAYDWIAARHATPSRRHYFDSRPPDGP